MLVILAQHLQYWIHITVQLYILYTRRSFHHIKGDFDRCEWYRLDLVFTNFCWYRIDSDLVVTSSYVDVITAVCCEWFRSDLISLIFVGAIQTRLGFDQLLCWCDYSSWIRSVWTPRSGAFSWKSRNMSPCWSKPALECRREQRCSEPFSR
jgi:hypothetical protein